MSNSLREEINLILEGEFYKPSRSMDRTNDIISLIEKRIDSRIKELHFLDDAIKIDELKKVKKEILK